MLAADELLLAIRVLALLEHMRLKPMKRWRIGGEISRESA